MNTLLKYPLGYVLIISLCSIFINACSMESSPWDVNVDAEYQDLTRKHLDALYARDPIVNDDGDFTFAIVGDPQGTPADFKAAIDEINRHDNVNFILILGDMTDYGLLHEYEWAAQVIV